jgi:competence protein ComEC
MHVPASIIALPLLAGSVLGIGWAEQADVRLILLAAGAALVALAAAGGALLIGDTPAAVAGLVAGSLMAGLSLGMSAAREAYDPPLLGWFLSRAAEAPVVLVGVLREDASPTPFGASMVIDVLEADGLPPEGRAHGGVRLSVGGALVEPHIQAWRAGRTIRLAATVRLPSVHLNPGVRDERRSLARRGIVLVGSVKSGALVEVVAAGSRLQETAAAIRAWTRQRIARHVGERDARAGGVTTAILIGDRTGLAREDERRMQEAGTYHVIAISGGNIAILAGLLLVAARLLLLPVRVASILTALALVAYGGIVVGAPSVSRAVTVAVLALAARVLDHRGAALNVLGVAAVLAVAASPLVVVDPSFILSFGATLAILLGVPLIVDGSGSRRGGVLRRMWRHLCVTLLALFAATACAEIALAPVGATLFSRVPLAGLLLNFAAIPLMTLVQAGGLAVVITAAWWEWAAGIAGTVAHLAAAGLLESARLVDVAPWLSVDVRPPARWLIAAYYISAAALLVRGHRRVAAVGLGLAGGLILLAPHAVSRDRVPGPAAPLRMTVLDVGQADATLLELPGGRALLVDAGGVPWLSPPADGAAPAFDVGERLVVPALRAMGLRRLDGLVITHADPDHVQGARSVVRRLRVGSVWDGVPVPSSADLRDLAAEAALRTVSWRSVQAGDVERFGDVEIRVLHPPPPGWERQQVRNDDSVVLEVRLGAVSLVLPGDIGQEGERAILPRLEPGRLVVLKAPHHGSASSSTSALLDRLRPAVAIFSCGHGNRFGHPHPAVIARYQARGAELFSTAEDGAVVVETNGVQVDVRAWTGRRVTFATSSPGVTPSSQLATPLPSPPASPRARTVPAARMRVRAPRTGH